MPHLIKKSPFTFKKSSVWGRSLMQLFNVRKLALIKGEVWKQRKHQARVKNCRKPDDGKEKNVQNYLQLEGFG